MKVKVISCTECGGSIKVSEGQFLSRCNYCGSEYYVEQKFPPSVRIKKSVVIDEAKNIVLKHLRNKNISREFLKNSYFEKGTLYFIPFVEIRGIKTRIVDDSTSGKKKFTYIAYEYIERGSELSEIDIGFIDMNIIEETLISAEQERFDLVEMRKAGVVLPVSDHLLEKDNTKYSGSELVEIHHRVIYIPVWEINYSYHGIVFHSYISAVDGIPIEIKAMKSQGRKMLFSIAGLAIFGILFAKIIKLGIILLKPMIKGNRISSLILFGYGGGFIIFLFVFFLLFPFFWEMFAFREFLIVRKSGMESETINFEDNFLTKLMKRFSEGFTKSLSSIKINVEDE